MNRVAVVGSLNMDMVSDVSHFPEPGETILARSYTEIPGGKGANQAYAAASLGSDVTILGAVGEDEIGDRLLSSLASVGVDTSHIKKSQKLDGFTGRAFITVDPSGQNNIVVAGGANLEVDILYIKEHLHVIDDCDVLLLQLEIPLETVIFCASYAHKLGKTVILDPAPVSSPLPTSLLESIDIITPNELEIHMLTDQASKSSVDVLADELCKMNVPNVIVTLGSEGSRLYKASGEVTHVPSIPVKVVDTTAAGDAYAGALGHAIALNCSIDEAMHLATKVASIVVSKKGASSSMPTRGEVNRN